MSDSIRTGEKTISEVIAEMKRYRNSPQLVRDWREMIPKGSRWYPNDPGDPACKECEGTGYLRIDGLPIGHPYFGKIVLCDCTRENFKPVPVQAPTRYVPPEDPPFLDDPYEQERQIAFDTGEGV